MTDVQYRVLQNRAARTAQRYRLKLEKQVNSLQAGLHKIATSKIVNSPKRYQQVYASFDLVKGGIADLQRALSDLIVQR